MKVSYNWLKDYVDIDYSPEELADKLTAAGIEVEEIIPLLPKFTGVVVGKVVKKKKHENADKLSVCEVDDGENVHQVICGAPNVDAGQIVPFAKVGAILAGDFKIKKAKIRGVESFGMICSKQELGMEKSSDGIWVLENMEQHKGMDLYDLLATDQDYIFDLFITPNRPDCLSMIGIARELAAITGKDLVLPESNLQENNDHSIADEIKIRIDTVEGCPRYAARLIKNVTVQESPAWMKRRLEAVGIRAINSIVDITNYVLMELGHPLHAFDLEEIGENTIIVRDSLAGEKFTTLDEKERLLPENTVMICDNKRAVAVGGIMGGLNSEVSAHTKNVLLEAAYFKRQRIAEASKKLGLSTEASQRFERGADPEAVPAALDRAAALMAELSGGEVATGIMDEYPGPQKNEDVPFRPERVNHVLGTDLDGNKMKDVLRRLGFRISGTQVAVPSFRVDVHQEIDLIEEIARLIGYDHLPVRTYTHFPYERPGGTENDKILSALKGRLIELGLNEALTNSMLKKEEALLFDKDTALTILNPISDDMVAMRPSLLPGLLKSVAFNINRNNHDLRLFEIGRIFKTNTRADIPDQPYHVAAVMTGQRMPSFWQRSSEPVDFFDLKGLVQSLLDKIFLDNISFILYDNHEYLEPEESMKVVFRDQQIGAFGRLKKHVLDYFDIESVVYAVELEAELILTAQSEKRQYKPVPRFPHVEKDLALVVDEAVLSEEVSHYIKKIGGSLLKSVEIFDVFRGDKLPQGKKSLAFRLRFQSFERTLSDEEVDEIFRKVITKSENTFKATLRDQ